MSGRAWREAVAVALVAAGGLILAFWAMTDARGKGVKPVFYQSYFEPAVRMACGQPFGIETGGALTTEMSAFLNLERETLSCESVTPAKRLMENPSLRVWYHLFVTTAALWKVTGISWGAIDLLAAAMMALMACFAYGIFRQLTPAPIAVVLAFASIVPARSYLLYLRDLNKAPFILAAVFLAVLLVSRRLSRPAFFATMGVAGLVVGVGYGFRPDALIGLPLLAVAAILLRPADGHRAWAEGVLGTLVMMGAFLLAASPIFTAYKGDLGSCNWHFPILGLSDTHTEMLGLKPGRISWLSHYEDGLAARTVEGYGERAFGLPYVGYCTGAYDRVSKALYLDIVSTFPADFLLRSIAGARQVVAYGFTSLPFIGPLEPVAEFVKAFRLPLQALWVLLWGVVVFVLTARGTRLGLFAAFALAYLCAYPVVQFDARHYFHLAFLAWIPVGLAAAGLWQAAATLRAGPPSGRPGLRAAIEGALPRRADARRAATVVGMFVAGGIAVALAAWLWQEHAVASLLDAYRRAPSADATLAGERRQGDAVRLTYRGLDPAPRLFRAGMLRVDFGGPACPPGAHSLTLATGGPRPEFEYRRRIEVTVGPGRSRALIFSPMYFQRGDLVIDEVWLSMPERDKACLLGAKWVEKAALPVLWVGATIEVAD